jgi:hypothetical protein
LPALGPRERQRTATNNNVQQRTTKGINNHQKLSDKPLLPTVVMSLSYRPGTGGDVGEIKEINFIPAYSIEVESVLRETMSGDDKWSKTTLRT